MHVSSACLQVNATVHTGVGEMDLPLVPEIVIPIDKSSCVPPTPTSGSKAFCFSHESSVILFGSNTLYMPILTGTCI